MFRHHPIFVPGCQPPCRGFGRAGGAPSTKFVTGQSLSASLRTNGGNFFHGFKFTVGASPITVTHLGRWIVSGNSQTHPIYLCDASGAVIGSSVNLDTSLGVAASFEYVAIGSPAVLSAATDYGVLCQEFSGSDSFYDGDTSLTTEVVATIIGSVYGSTTEGAAMNVSAPGQVSYGPLSFMYQ
jgi:hypothetical protein